MAELTISINSRSFQIMCADGEEAQVKKLAEDLATRVGSLKDRSGQAGDSHLLVLAGLTLCSELRDLHRDLANTKEDLKRLNEARGALNDRITDMENTIAEALTGAAERVEALIAEKDETVATNPATSNGGSVSVPDMDDPDTDASSPSADAASDDNETGDAI